MAAARRPVLASDLELTTTWAVHAAFTHHWDPAWKSTLWGSYRAVNYNTNANAMLCSASRPWHQRGTAAVANVGCDMDWAAWGAGLRTEWAISSSFQIGVEVMYANLEQRADRWANTIVCRRTAPNRPALIRLPTRTTGRSVCASTAPSIRDRLSVV